MVGSGSGLVLDGSALDGLGLGVRVVRVRVTVVFLVELLNNISCSSW